MKIFISWSGNRSKEVAELFHEWIQRVLQATKPWISTNDIERGAIWFNEIKDQLGESAHGLVILTQENRVAPWIMYEAGSLARGLSNSRVLTFLVDLEPQDVAGPLSQFNHTARDRENVKKLVTTLNNHLAEARLSESALADVFDTYWPKFEDRLKQILSKQQPALASPKRSPDELLAEILENTRQLRISDQQRQQTDWPIPAGAGSHNDALSQLRRTTKRSHDYAAPPVTAIAGKVADEIRYLVISGNSFEDAIRSAMKEYVPAPAIIAVAESLASEHNIPSDVVKKVAFELRLNNP